MKPFDPDINWYYNKGKEATRLDTACKLEAVRTRHIIANRLPGRPVSILDIGGGAGAYSFWLADMGHEVHLLDPIELHIEQARKAEKKSAIDLAGIHHGHAEELPFDDDRFDIAIALGPLYHIVERERRIEALRESIRILRTGGILFAAGISRYGAVIDGFFRDYVSQPHYAEMMHKTLADGQHRNPNRQDGLFTTAYFHMVEELRNELEEAGFVNVEMLAIEGPWTCIPDFDKKWKDESFRLLLLETLEQMESDPSVTGLGGHIMAVGVAP